MILNQNGEHDDHRQHHGMIKSESNQEQAVQDTSSMTSKGLRIGIDKNKHIDQSIQLTDSLLEQSASSDSSTVSLSISSSTNSSSPPSFLSSSSSTSPSSNWIVQSLSNSQLLAPTVPDLTFSFDLSLSSSHYHRTNHSDQAPVRKDTTSTVIPNTTTILDAETPILKTFETKKDDHPPPGSKDEVDEDELEESLKKLDRPLGHHHRDILIDDPASNLLLDPCMLNDTDPSSQHDQIKIDSSATPTKSHHTIINHSATTTIPPTNESFLNHETINHRKTTMMTSTQRNKTVNGQLKNRKSFGFPLSNHHHHHRTRNPSLESQLDVITQSNKIHHPSPSLVGPQTSINHQNVDMKQDQDQSNRCHISKKSLDENGPPKQTSRRFSSYLPFFNRSMSPSRDSCKDSTNSPAPNFKGDIKKHDQSSNTNTKPTMPTTSSKALNRSSFNILNRPSFSLSSSNSKFLKQPQQILSHRDQRSNMKINPNPNSITKPIIIDPSSDLPSPNHHLESSSSCPALSHYHHHHRHQYSNTSTSSTFFSKQSRSFLNLLSSKLKE